ncbi:MAG: TetR/AcrR family transcriptional regulator [Pseudomonadales bacterium]|nr:TetR/AcrR family transcriptional regulator [Pseudomonadales bacterium]
MEKKAKKSVDGRRKKRPGIAEQTAIIIDAAVQLFIEQGAQNSSIAQICAKADVSKPTFYRCFKDKESLISQLYQRAVDRHVVSLLTLPLPQNSDGQIKLDTALDELFDALFKEADLVQLLIREYNDPLSPASEIIDNTFERIAKEMLKSIKKRSANPPSKTFLKAMMAAFQWLAYDAIKSGLAPQQVKKAKKAAHELAAALMAVAYQQ